MAFLPTAPFLTLLSNSPPSTLAWHSPAHNTGSHLTIVAPPSVSPRLFSPSKDHGHVMLCPAIASSPSPQHLRLKTIFGSTATHNVMAVKNLAPTPYAAPTRHAVAGLLVSTPRGTIPVPPPPATRRAALAHTPRLSVSHATALIKHTLPCALSLLPLSPVRWVGRMTRCTSTGGFSPSRGHAPSSSRAPAPLHLWLGDLSSLLIRFSTAHTLGPSD